jgi:hypothetical protein
MRFPQREAHRGASFAQGMRPPQDIIKTNFSSTVTQFTVTA